MNRPGWVTAVGILGIFFGCLGIMASGQVLVISVMTRYHRGLFAEYGMPGFFRGMTNVPDWYYLWSIGAGLAGILVSLFFVFASMRLFWMRRNAERLFYWAAGSTIAFTLIKGGGDIAAMPVLGLATAFWKAVWIIIAGVLIFIVASSDKRALQ